ncbi:MULTISPECIES: deoxyribose-phosphate aldolase [unclassified Facklamia]|uniref:deoxyribose-phosphate aldolase n=1 Tax=Aerococcaceae TaxID=186827 RepID=UPI0013BE4E50|nr:MULTISPECIES: deoxyribose-phosphate aldolase [unclassified Facklamia]MBS4460972.1 deoxyribose-phosphate aldolase [Aerococcaceae bacterium zg-B36]NEW64835.1 deoxyribose-phosphate aldolase [Facklamia sp. 252]NEW68157.1 deoxyribose-phosphate aldolase [Facklamia sp. 253]QQD64988.1 deoxyribose-phosphate aldolase [Aerococcaceae bacterium zg-252]
MTKLAKYIDHTLLKADATAAQIAVLCSEAAQYDFMSVCVNPTWVKTAAEALKNTDVKVCTVIGFPLGANTSTLKAFEAKEAVELGADEVDMVINIGAAKAGNWDLVQDDIRAVVEAVPTEVIVKVIIETCLLTDEEKVKACQAAVAAGADFVKTSTGFSTGGATVEDIRLMRKTVGADLGVKASGGVSTTAEAEAMIAAGATRIGASKGIAIVTNQAPADTSGY